MQVISPVSVDIDTILEVAVEIWEDRDAARDEHLRHVFLSADEDGNSSLDFDEVSTDECVSTGTTDHQTVYCCC